MCAEILCVILIIILGLNLISFLDTEFDLLFEPKFATWKCIISTKSNDYPLLERFSSVGESHKLMPGKKVVSFIQAQLLCNSL